MNRRAFFRSLASLVVAVPMGAGLLRRKEIEPELLTNWGGMNLGVDWGSGESEPVLLLQHDPSKVEVLGWFRCDGSVEWR